MEIVKAASTQDFLAMVPALAGCDVARSIVFVPFRGKRTFGTACRIDLPSRGRRADIRTVVHGALGVLSRIRDADRVDVVVYTDRSFESERGIPYLELGRAAVDGLRRAGFHVGLAACVASDGWGDYLDRSHQAGRPLDEVEASAAGVRARELIAEEIGSRDRDVPDADPAAREKVARILGFAPHDPDEELEYFEHEMPTVDWFEMVLTGHDEPLIVAMALEMFDDPASRDTALLHYAFGREIGMAAGESGQGIELSNMLLGRTERIPDRERLGAAIRMLRAVVAHAPDELRPGPLTMLGWCLWAIGSAAAAGAMLDRATKLAPEYRMAALLRTWVDAGALPDWLFNRLESPR